MLIGTVQGSSADVRLKGLIYSVGDKFDISKTKIILFL